MPVGSIGTDRSGGPMGGSRGTSRGGGALGGAMGRRLGGGDFGASRGGALGGAMGRRLGGGNFGAPSGTMGRVAGTMLNQSYDVNEDNNFGTFLAKLLGGYESVNPYSAAEGVNEATWGFDPAGMIGTGVGAAFGMPGLGSLAGLASGAMGHPLGISFDSRMNRWGGGGATGGGGHRGGRGDFDPRMMGGSGRQGLLNTPPAAPPQTPGMMNTPPAFPTPTQPAQGLMAFGQPGYDINSRFGRVTMPAYLYG